VLKSVSQWGKLAWLELQGTHAGKGQQLVAQAQAKVLRAAHL
jgi:hypothetical protein